MRKLFLALLVMLAGCATMTVPGIERSESVQVKDLRPKTEKESESFSINVFNDAYATYRVADSAITPPAIRLLQHRAYEKFGASNAPLEIKIHHLVVYRNFQAELRRGGISAIPGVLVYGQVTTAPAGIASSLVDGKTFESLAATEYKRSLYSEQENPGRGSVLVVYVETEIQGNRIFTRTLAPAKEKNGVNPLIAAIEASIKFNLAQYQ
jgi:hypothetical protein